MLDETGWLGGEASFLSLVVAFSLTSATGAIVLEVNGQQTSPEVEDECGVTFSSAAVASGPSTAKSRKGFLLFGPGEVGNEASIGVESPLPPEVETALTRNGFVSEFDSSDCGIAGDGVGSSKGDTLATAAGSESVIAQTR